MTSGQMTASQAPESIRNSSSLASRFVKENIQCEVSAAVLQPSCGNGNSILVIKDSGWLPMLLLASRDAVAFPVLDVSFNQRSFFM